MLFFSKKQKVEIGPYCQLFYENVVLNCVVNGVDINAKIFETLKNALADTHPNFVDIDSQKFNNEIVALQFELYALAWLHQFGDKLAVAQSVFTKNYLNEKKQNDIWEAMEPYNQAIARSPAIGKTMEKAFDRVYFIKVNTTRSNLFDQYHKEGFDDKCVARVLNRLFSEDAWKKGVTASLLLFALCDRLGFGKDFEPSKETHHRWFIELNDFYEKDRASLSKVKLK